VRRRNLELLIAWLDAARRGDRDAMRAMLADDATWQGVRTEWRCETPGEVIDMWLERSEALIDLETVELAADDDRAVLSLRAPSLAQVDPRLRLGLHIAFEIDADGRVTHLVDNAFRRDIFPPDPETAPRGIPEAPVRDGQPAGEGWFVVNVADARWLTGAFGAYARFDGDDVRFEQVGVNVGVLEPGQPACWYHREADQEGFLVLKGEALLLVEGEERRLGAWDYVHCPPWTEHVFVGAGEQPCTILALGARSRGGVVYPVSEPALRHHAGVSEQTTSPKDAYAAVPDDEPATFDPEWLPGD
jgi:uncharacterized cupin superfamily protein